MVDLPGVADANAARSCIAKDYMKKCDCIWILAPITRAVDDKTARGMSFTPLYARAPYTSLLPVDLLGDAFKSQLLSKSSFVNKCQNLTALLVVGKPRCVGTIPTDV